MAWWDSGEFRWWDSGEGGQWGMVNSGVGER